MGGKCKMTRTHIHSLPEKHGQTGQLKQSGKIGNKQVDSRSIVVGMITYSYSTSPQCGLHISHSARFSTTTYINLVPPTASPAAPPMVCLTGSQSDCPPLLILGSSPSPFTCLHSLPPDSFKIHAIAQQRQQYQEGEGGL